jgi:hypothetical protein
MPDETVFEMVCLVDREDAIRRLKGGGSVTLSHPDPQVEVSATIRSTCIESGAPRRYSYEVTIHLPLGDLRFNDSIMHLDLDGVIEWVENHIFAC